MRIIAFWLFGEEQDVPPSDRVGTVGDLGVEPGINAPVAVRGWTGRGRSFNPASSHGFVALDNDDPNTTSLLTRDCSVQALISLNMSVSAGVMTLVSRGIDGSDSEYYAYGVELQAGLIAGDIDVRWFWQTRDGTIRTQTAATFTSPGDGLTFLLTCTRRWESSTRAVCRIYLADKLVSETVGAEADIGGGTTGHLSIGARHTAGTWGRFFAGTIEQLAIYDYELAGEEIEAQWRRLSLHQPDGVARFRALSPPGAPWSERNDSSIGRAVRMAGEILGIPAATAEESRNILPDRAYEDAIDRWEEILGLEPRPLDSLDTRRQAVLAYLQRENGLSRPVIQRVLAPVLDLIPQDVEIIEYSNTIVEPFDELREERFFLENSSVWSADAGELLLNAPSGSTLGPAHPDQCHVRMPIVEGLRGAPANGAGCVAQVKISSVATWPTATNLIAGLFVYEYLTGESLWIGVTKVGADYVLAHRSFIAGVLSAVTSIVTLGASPTVYIRASRIANPSQMTVEYSTVDFETVAASTTITSPANPSYVGLSAVCDGTTSAAALDMRFDDLALRCPDGRRAFHWYVYRHPSLPDGDPDMKTARLLVGRFKPAHTHADAITTKSLLCDSASSVCDGGPMGGF